MTVQVPEAGQPLYWLGGPIDVRVEVDTGPGAELGGLWDSAEWDVNQWSSVDPDWQDFTFYVLAVQITQGAERWGERFAAGTCAITVDNTTGIFTPDATGVGADPFFRAFRPGRRIRVVAIPDAATGAVVPLFTGRLDASPATFADAGHDVTATLYAFDFMADWQASNPLAGPATGVQSTDERVNAALDVIDWPSADRDIQAGDHTMQSADLAQTTLEECQRAADAEGSAFFCSKDGKATFRNIDWLTTDTRSVDIQGYVGYSDVPIGAQAAHLLDVVPNHDLARVVNAVQFARSGGTMQTVTDAASILAYGGTPRTYQRTDFHNATDAEVLALAVKYLNARKDLRVRFDAVSIGAVSDPAGDDLNRLIWDTELGDRLSVLVETQAGWSLEREAHVFGIDHMITGDDWQTTLRLDDAQALELEYWVLEDPILGVLGETTRVM